MGYVNGASGSYEAVTPYTFLYSPTAGNTLFVAMNWNGSPTSDISGITDSFSEAWEPFAFFGNIDGSGSNNLSIWWCKNIGTTGGTTLSISWSKTGSDEMGVCLVEYTSLPYTDAAVAHTSGTASSCFGPSLVTHYNNDVVMGFGQFNSANPNVQSPFNARQTIKFSGTPVCSWYDYSPGSAGTYQAEVTQGSGSYYMIGFSQVPTAPVISKNIQVILMY